MSFSDDGNLYYDCLCHIKVDIPYKGAIGIVIDDGKDRSNLEEIFWIPRSQFKYNSGAALLKKGYPIRIKGWIAEKKDLTAQLDYDSGTTE